MDVGSRHDIINAIREAARDGCGVIISSVDAADLAVLCDRVLVFSDGKVVTELGGELTQDEITTKLRETREQLLQLAGPYAQQALTQTILVFKNHVERVHQIKLRP